MARRPLKDFLQSATPEAAHMVNITFINAFIIIVKIRMLDDEDDNNDDDHHQVETLLKLYDYDDNDVWHDNDNNDDDDS